jgi:hypothetical protein
MLEALRKFMNVFRPTALYFYDFLFVFRVGHLASEADIIQIEQAASGFLLIPFLKKVLKKTQQKKLLSTDSWSIMRFSRVGWQEISERRMSKVRGKEISMIFQNPKQSMNPFMTVGRQITEAIRLHTAINEEPAAKERAIEWLDRVQSDGTDARAIAHKHNLPVHLDRARLFTPPWRSKSMPPCSRARWIPSAFASRKACRRPSDRGLVLRPDRAGGGAA